MKVIDQITKENYALYQGDCVEVLKGIPDNSIHYSIFSPPFASLYTYSNSDRDMGNCSKDEQFYKQFEFLVSELYRVIKPGRLISFHCMNLPMMKSKDGVIGLKDFRGELIKLFVDAGFIFHSEVCIWKNPVTEMQRTKALGLLHKQIKKDSSMCRQGIPDYLITMRKPGENLERITHTNESFPVDLWQNYASPVWMDIKQSNTLQRNSARDEKDERHICPLQLDVIQRGIELWSNPGDIVLDPFAGIGSSIYQALLMNRKGVGIELKDSYFKQAKLNCENAAKKVEERANEITMEDYIKRMMAN
ncbi:DNA-methyltransferase [Intestinibacter bartlettii]|jgi:helicase domain protein|uniref:DNA-methyltransferase n=1 Tax=Intestinibacter bartlettii TaxID=261299 RepID=UPI0020517ED6|nr:MAG TPA: Helicase of the snf2 rad54 family [Caudoviricetes sp.]